MDHEGQDDVSPYSTLPLLHNACLECAWKCLFIKETSNIMKVPLEPLYPRCAFVLRRLYGPVQCSGFVSARGRKYLSIMKTGERRRTPSNQITAELNLVAQPVGWKLTRSKSYKTVAQIPAWRPCNYSDSSREKRGSRHLGAALSFLECRLFLSYRDLPKRLLMCGRTRQYRIISLREE